MVAQKNPHLPSGMTASAARLKRRRRGQSVAGGLPLERVALPYAAGFQPQLEPVHALGGAPMESSTVAL